MEKTQNAIASASNINVLSNFNQDSLSSMKDTVRHTALRGYSKAQQDDILGEALLHLCETANNGYFSDVKALNVLSAKCFVILRHKAGDERDKIQTSESIWTLSPKTYLMCLTASLTWRRMWMTLKIKRTRLNVTSMLSRVKKVT